MMRLERPKNSALTDLRGAACRSSSTRSAGRGCRRWRRTPGGRGRRRRASRPPRPGRRQSGAARSAGLKGMKGGESYEGGRTLKGQKMNRNCPFQREIVAYCGWRISPPATGGKTTPITAREIEPSVKLVRVGRWHPTHISLHLVQRAHTSPFFH